MNQIERWDNNGWSRRQVVFAETFSGSENKSAVELGMPDKQEEINSSREAIRSPQRNLSREKDKLNQLQAEIQFEKRKAAKVLRRREAIEETENHMKL